MAYGLAASDWFKPGFTGNPLPGRISGQDALIQMAQEGMAGPGAMSEGIRSTYGMPMWSPTGPSRGLLERLKMSMSNPGMYRTLPSPMPSTGFGVGPSPGYRPPAPPMGPPVSPPMGGPGPQPPPSFSTPQMGKTLPVRGSQPTQKSSMFKNYGRMTGSMRGRSRPSY